MAGQPHPRFPHRQQNLSLESGNPDSLDGPTSAQYQRPVFPPTRKRPPVPGPASPTQSPAASRPVQPAPAIPQPPTRIGAVWRELGATAACCVCGSRRWRTAPSGRFTSAGAAATTASAVSPRRQGRPVRRRGVCPSRRPDLRAHQPRLQLQLLRQGWEHACYTRAASVVGGRHWPLLRVLLQLPQTRVETVA